MEDKIDRALAVINSNFYLRFGNRPVNSQTVQKGDAQAEQLRIVDSPLAEQDLFLELRSINRLVAGHLDLSHPVDAPLIAFKDAVDHLFEVLDFLLHRDCEAKVSERVVAFLNLFS